MAKLLHVERKRDGRWTRIVTSATSRVMRIHGHRLGRLGQVIELEIDDAIVFEAWQAPTVPNSVFDGELIWPGHLATAIPTAIKECPEQLRYLPFAVPRLRGQDLTAELYSPARQRCRDEGVELPECLWTIPRDTPLDRIKEWWSEAAETGQWKTEGFVFKGYFYHDWYKWKPPHRIYAVCVGLGLGRAGKWAGDANGIHLMVLDEHGDEHDLGRCGTGFDDATRKALDRDCIGRVCLVEFDEMTVNRKLKFPRFKGWQPESMRQYAVASQLPSDAHNW